MTICLWADFSKQHAMIGLADLPGRQRQTIEDRMTENEEQAPADHDSDPMLPASSGG